MPFGTIVDSSVLLDVFTDDERWGSWSAEHLASARTFPGTPRFSPVDASRSTAAEVVSAARRYLTSTSPPTRQPPVVSC